MMTQASAMPGHGACGRLRSASGGSRLPARLHPSPDHIGFRRSGASREQGHAGTDEGAPDHRRIRGFRRSYKRPRRWQPL
jgi:hypothetical protein